MAGKGGGAWKVAYADFVTAMMAFFLVMWITAQDKPVRQSIASYFRDPFAVGNENGPASSRRQGSNIPSPDVEEHGGSLKRPRLRTREPGNPTRNGTTIYFDGSTATLSQTAQSQLAALAQQMHGKPNRIEIRGHASRLPIPPESGFQDAWQLSYARCLATMEYLTEHGIRPERLRLSQAGAYEPRSAVTKEFQPAEDSRVEVFALGEFVSAPAASWR